MSKYWIASQQQVFFEAKGFCKNDNREPGT